MVATAVATGDARAAMPEGAVSQCSYQEASRMLAAACLTYWVGTRKALVAYGLLGFAGFAHFFIRHQASLPLRCTITIGAEAGASALLIAYALLRRDPERS